MKPPRAVWAPLLFGIGVGVGTIVSISSSRLTEAPAAGEDPAAGARAARPLLGTPPASFAEVVKAVYPSVVQVNVVRRFRQRDPFFPLMDDPFFEHFFGRPRERIVEQPSLGSGVIVDEAGHILTNSHVVSSASEIEVLLSDGRSIRASLVGDDPLTDLAVIRIRDRDIQPAPLGDSTAVEVGEWVLAIGSPMGFSHTVTEGIVSATGRRTGAANDTRTYQHFLQTSAAINPGNSGGPLVNLRGEVIGINTAIASYVGQSAGIGFAIPSDLAREVMEALLENDGVVPRGWLGVAVRPARAGPEIIEIVRGGPAHRHGLRVGDVVLTFGGEPARDPDDFIRRVFRSKEGERVPITVMRGRERISGTIEVGSHPLSR